MSGQVVGMFQNTPRQDQGWEQSMMFGWTDPLNDIDNIQVENYFFKS